MKKVAIVVAVLVAMFMGVGGILPALAKVRDVGAIPSAFVGSYTLGVFFAHQSWRERRLLRHQKTQGGLNMRCREALEAVKAIVVATHACRPPSVISFPGSLMD